MAGNVYYMTCADMPHLIKIGFTVNEHLRLREANSHDTFKPPSGFLFGEVVRVANMRLVEHSLHVRFAEHRLKNPHGNSTEFFKINEQAVRDAFAEVEGERVDLSTLSQIAESLELARIRLLLRSAIDGCRPCVYQEPNPKHAGTKCHTRYETYKTAKTMDAALALGTFEDIVYDFTASYLTFTMLPSSEWS